MNKTTKKPILLASIVGVMLIPLILLTGCPSKKEIKDSKKITITATFYPMYIMLLNITENVPNIEVTMLAPAETGCLHDYQLSTRDMKTIDGSDIIVANGAGMEEFLEKVLDTKDKSQIIEATVGFPLLEGNPHVWVSPKGAMYQVTRIAEGLAQLNPENGNAYIENAKKYNEKLQQLDTTMKSELQNLHKKPIITFHEAFPYFAQEFNLNLLGSVDEEHHHGGSPNPKELSEIITKINDLIKTGETPVLFIEEGHSSPAAEIISTETNLPIFQLNPAVTGLIEKNAYISIMEKNCKVLKEALN